MRVWPENGYQRKPAMPDARPKPDDFDFEGEMKNLASQAQARTSSSGIPARSERSETLIALGQMIKPLAVELESLKRANSDQTALLNAFGKIINAQPAAATALETISQQMQRLNSVESANSKLFDALHAELKGYKDNFLFDTLQKPFIRDLVSLFDDLSAMHEQMVRRLADSAADKDSPDRTFLKNIAGNAENQVHHMIEVFLRMDVTLSKTAVGAPVDKKLHRIMSFEPAAHADDDGLVARSLRPGFFWRERAIRPEEIVARRWTAPAASDANPAFAETVLIPPAAV